MSAPMLAALAASQLRPAFFVEATFATETLRMWTGVGSTTWNGHTWAGVGSFGGVSLIEEGATVEARGITLTLSGIDPETLADALQEIRIGLPVTIYVALYDASFALIADPPTSWSGRIDQPVIDVTGATATISIACESRLLEMGVPADRRYTLEDSSISSPGDLGFQFVNALQEISINWGSVPSASQNI